MDNLQQVLTEAEHAAICAVAAGDKTRLAAATTAFERAAAKHGVASSVALQFMSEVLAPLPDLLLRSSYRKAVLAASGSR